MNRPSFWVYLIGNPLSALAAVAFGLHTLYESLLGPAPWSYGLIGTVAMGCCVNASNRIQTYASWKRAWDGIGGAPAQRSFLSRHGTKLAMVLMLAALFVISLGQNKGPLTTPALMIWFAIGLPIWITTGFVYKRWRQNRTQRHSDSVVAITVSRPLLDTPPLSVAYQRLPPHCLHVLQAPSANHMQSR